MKKVLLLSSAIAWSLYAAAQCSAPTVIVTQNPVNVPCNGSATLTANLPTTDVDQPQNNTCMANFSQTGLAQSFITTVTSLCGAGVYITSGSGSGSVTLTLYDNLPTMGGNILASGTVSNITVGMWADVTWPSAAVIPGNTYYIVMTSTNGNLCVAGSTNNPYSGGMVYANSGYQAFPSYDYTFHTTTCVGNSPTYAWSTGGNTSSITVTASGVYTVTVTVANCTNPTVVSTTVNIPGATATATSTNVTCPGGTNGTASVSASGGTPPYTYTWSNFASGPNLTGLSAGSYTCTISDNSGCTTSAVVNITQPAAFNTSAVTTNVDCHGNQNGAVNFTVSGGTGAYSYNWNSGQYTTEDISNLNGGTYVVVVTDANNCTTTATYNVNEPAAFNTSAVVTNIDCHGNQNGEIDFTANGGAGGYSFSWNNGQYTTEDISNLSGGTYVVVLTDANNCTTTATYTITDPPALVANIVAATGPSSCGGNNGSITVTVNGGAGGYSYSWSNSTSSPNLTNVSAGSYTCTISDANGCTQVVSQTLTDPALPVVTLSIPNTDVCIADGPFTLTGESPAGGTFAGTGVTAGSFDPAAAGIGTHEIIYTYTDPAGCTASISDTITVDICLGAGALANHADVSVYPNPNNGSFNVVFNGTEAAVAELYDVKGQLVSTQKIQPGVIVSFQLSETGVYMLTIISADGGRTTKRVVVTE